MGQDQRYGNVFPYSGGMVVDRNPGVGIAVWVGRVVVGVHYLVVIVFGLGVFGEFVGWRGLQVVGWVVAGG